MRALDDYRAGLGAQLDALERQGLRRRLRPGQGLDLTSNDTLA